MPSGLLDISSPVYEHSPDAQALMPDWIQTVSMFNPISYTVDAIRALMINGYVWDKIIMAYAVIALIATVTLGATLYQFRKVVS